MTATMPFTRSQADALYDAKQCPKTVQNMKISEAYTSVAPGAVNSGYLVRGIWPESGSVDRVMVFCNVQGGAANVELGLYDTTPVTRNRLRSGSTTCLASSWREVVFAPLTVAAGDFFEWALGVDSVLPSFASSYSVRHEMCTLPTGWMPIPSGGEPRLSAFKSSGMFPLPATISYASLSIDGNVPLMMARYL